MSLIGRLQQELEKIDAQHLRRRRRTVESACTPRMLVDGKPMLAFCSNDYLGLAAHPAVRAALQEGAGLYGVGSGASPLINGYSKAHAQLEEQLAEFLAPHLERPRALYLNSGYAANLAMVTALGVRDAEIFSESLNHASLIDGAKLAKAKVQVFPHADYTALENLLRDSRAQTKLVVTDSVFSMDGELADLPTLLKLCEEYDAWLLVDDAHGFGILGQNGRGALEHFDLRSPNLVYMGTLSKAGGVSGAFVAAHESVIETIIQSGRAYIYATADAPALAHALQTSVRIIASAEGRQRRTHVRQLIAQLQQDLHLRNWKMLPSQTAIQPLLLGENALALQVAGALLERGIWVPAIRPPTVPEGTARLRITLSAAHSSDDVAQLCAVLNTLEPA